MKRPGSQARFFLVLTAVCLVNYFFWLLMCFPGVLYGDNAMMMAEAMEHGHIGDQHSVMYTWLLQKCYDLFGIGLGYPFIWGLLGWHIGVFGFCAGFYARYRTYWALMFALVFCQLPFISFILPHLQLKDINMSAIFFGAAGLLFWYWMDARKRIFVLAASILLLYFAATLRHNALFALIPFAVILGALLLVRLKRPPSVSVRGVSILLMSSFVILCGFFLLKTVTEKASEDYENYFIHGCLFSFDLAGISVIENKMQLPPDRLKDGITLTELRAVFRPVSWDPLWGGLGDGPRILKGGETREDFRRLRAKWMNAVAADPHAYLLHRQRHFTEFIEGRNVYLCICEWPPEVGWNVVNSLISDADKSTTINTIPRKAFALNAPGFLAGFQKFNQDVERTIGGLPYMIVSVNALVLSTLASLLALAGWCFALRRPARFSESQRLILPFAAAVLLSGWVYFIAYFFVSVHTDWRYVHWTSLTVWIGLALLAVANPFSALGRKRVGQT